MSGIRKRTTLVCVLICLLLLGHPALDVYESVSKSATEQTAPYSLSSKPLSDRVVLIVLDSWAVRIMQSPRWMPKLYGRLPQGASGLLWQTNLTETAKGVEALSTGIESFNLDQQSLVFSHPHRGWSIFDDVVARGQTVTFAGGPIWVAMFGARGTDNGPENGEGPNFRGDDVAGLLRLETALRSPKPPSLSVLHISETDFAAHQYGTTTSAYGNVMGFWDDKLDSFLNEALTPGTTVIITADHGNDLNGSHGGSGDIYRGVPILMWGAGISPGAKIEMHAVDMPVTIAALLGVRAPADAVALPAVEAFQIAPAEQYRILSAAYAQAVLKNPRVTSNPSLLAKAQAATQTGTAQNSQGGAPLAVSPADMEAVAGDIAQLRNSFNQLRPDLLPERDWRVSDWLFVIIALFSAAGLLMVSDDALNPRGRSFWGHPGIAAVVFLFIEALLVVRFALSSALKGVLGQRDTGLIAAAIAVLCVAITLCFAAWRRRRALLMWAESHVVTVALLAWLLFSAVRPVNAVGLAGLVTTIALLRSSEWTARKRFVVGTAFAVYFIAGNLLLWPRVGESLIARYIVGAPIVLIAGLILFLGQNHRSRAYNSFAVAMLAMLAAFPAGSVGFIGWSLTSTMVLASALTVAFCYGASKLIPIPWWVWLAPVSVLAFWWFPQSTLFYVAFALCVCVLAATILQTRFSLPCRMGIFVSTLCLLLIMSPPTKCLTLLVYCGALVAFLFGKPVGVVGKRFIALMALLIVGLYYMIFELFTGVTDGLLSVGMGNLDLPSAYVGDPARSIIAAILIAVFKAWLVFLLLAVSIGLFKHLRQHFAAIAGLAGTLLLLNVTQLSLLTAMSVHRRSDLYSNQLFALLLTTGMFVFGASAVGLVAWCIFEKNAKQAEPKSLNGDAVGKGRELAQIQ